MKRLQLISLMILLLCACSKEIARQDSGYLCLDGISAAPVPGVSASAATKAIDSDFTIRICDMDGKPIQGMTFDPGTFPSMLTMNVGEYIISAVTMPKEEWLQFNDGRGIAAYGISKEFSILPEWTTYLNLTVPFTNYALRFQTQEGFDFWFKDCSLSITEGTRSLLLQEDQFAWFDSSQLNIRFNVTNTDNDSYSTEVLTISNLKAGHVYTLNYSISPAQDGSVDIIVDIDDQFDDVSDPDDDVTID